MFVGLKARVLFSPTLTVWTTGCGFWTAEVVVVAGVVVVVVAGGAGGAVVAVPLAMALSRNFWKVFPVAGAFTANTIPAGQCGGGPICRQWNHRGVSWNRSEYFDSFQARRTSLTTVTRKVEILTSPAASIGWKPVSNPPVRFVHGDWKDDWVAV